MWYIVGNVIFAIVNLGMLYYLYVGNKASKKYNRGLMLVRVYEYEDHRGFVGWVKYYDYTNLKTLDNYAKRNGRYINIELESGNGRMVDIENLAKVEFYNSLGEITRACILNRGLV